MASSSHSERKMADPLVLRDLKSQEHINKQVFRCSKDVPPDAEIQYREYLLFGHNLPARCPRCDRHYRAHDTAANTYNCISLSPADTLFTVIGNSVVWLN